MPTAYIGQEITITPTGDDIAKTIDVGHWNVFRVIDDVEEGSPIEELEIVATESQVDGEDVLTYTFSHSRAVDEDLNVGNTLKYHYVPSGTESDFAEILDWESPEYTIIGQGVVSGNNSISVSLAITM